MYTDDKFNALNQLSINGTKLFLLGVKVVLADDMPTIASNALSVAYGNFSVGYQILDRAGISLLRDPYSAKPFVEFYFTKRVGGEVLNKDAIKIGKIAS
jgi:HK97 family phage major capsid protein